MLFSPAISRSKSGWKIMAQIPASIVDMNKVMMDGTFRAISIPVTKGTISNQGVIVKVSFKVRHVCSRVCFDDESHYCKDNQCDNQRWSGCN